MARDLLQLFGIVQSMVLTSTRFVLYVPKHAAFVLAHFDKQPVVVILAMWPAARRTMAGPGDLL